MTETAMRDSALKFSPASSLPNSKVAVVVLAWVAIVLLFSAPNPMAAQSAYIHAQLAQRLCHAPEITSGPEFDKMEAIHTRIEPVLSNVPEHDIDVAVVASGVINAWDVHLAPRSDFLCMPVAMVRFMGDGQGELAFIVAHELGHALDDACKSPGARAQMTNPTLSGALGRLLVGPQWDRLQEQKTCEARADEIGFRIFTAAGYLPFDAAGAFGRLEMYLGDSGLAGRLRSLQSDHPVTPDRIRHMRTLLFEQTP